MPVFNGEYTIAHSDKLHGEPTLTHPEHSFIYETHVDGTAVRAKTQSVLRVRVAAALYCVCAARIASSLPSRLARSGDLWPLHRKQ